LLAVTMAFLSRVLSVRGTADLITALNVILSVGAIAVVLHRTRRLLEPVWWWIAAVALVSFVPLMSSVWYKQFNPIVLVLALAGFDLVRRGREQPGAAAIGFSVAFKPMAILLPFVMLARRDTRRAGALALAWTVGFTVAAQAVLALRAHHLGTLDPLIALRNFTDRSKPSLFTCVDWNFSPGALLCRQVGVQHPTLQRLAVWCFVLLLGGWVVRSLRGRPATSWEVAAFSLALSAMVSPLAWNHYQLMLAPLFFLLLVRFAREGASPDIWAGLLVAFVLASLIWQPYGSIADAIRALIPGVRHAVNRPLFLEGFAQFAQYVLVLTGVIWYRAGRLAGQGTGRQGGRKRVPT
jgi:Glycosyltransferase family 87